MQLCALYLMVFGHLPISKAWTTQRQEQEACTFTCWCSLPWAGRSSPHSHKVCSRSLQSPSIPPCTCHNVALPPQACKGSHHCWGRRRSPSWKEGSPSQLGGRNMLQQKRQGTDERPSVGHLRGAYAWQVPSPHQTACFRNASFTQLMYACMSAAKRNLELILKLRALNINTFWLRWQGQMRKVEKEHLVRDELQVDDVLKQCFSAFLMLLPFNTVLHVAMTSLPHP